MNAPNIPKSTPELPSPASLQRLYEITKRLSQATPDRATVYIRDGFVKIRRDGLLCLGCRDIEMELETFSFGSDMGRPYHEIAGSGAALTWLIDRKGHVRGGQSFSVGWQEIDGKKAEESSHIGSISPPSAAFIANVLAQLESRVPARPQEEKTRIQKIMNTVRGWFSANR